MGIQKKKKRKSCRLFSKKNNLMFILTTQNF